MAAEIIPFNRRRDFRQGEASCEQRIPWTSTRGSRPCNPIELQVARITKLLTELEELIGTTEDRASISLTEARLQLERARAVIRPWTLAEENDRDPQPHVDYEHLEQMYRDFNRDT